MMHMRIGFIVDNEFNEDPRVGNEVKAMQKAGFAVHVLCLNYGKHLNEEYVNNIHITRVPVSKTIKNWMFGFINAIPLYHFF